MPRRQVFEFIGQREVLMIQKEALDGGIGFNAAAGAGVHLRCRAGLLLGRRECTLLHLTAIGCLGRGLWNLGYGKTRAAQDHS